MEQRELDPEQERAGLCASCANTRRVETKIGATIYLCRLSAKDERFPKFPPLPTLACPGFEKAAV